MIQKFVSLKHEPASGTAAHFCDVVVLKLRTVLALKPCFLAPRELSLGFHRTAYTYMFFGNEICVMTGASVFHHRDVDRHSGLCHRRLQKMNGGPASGLMKWNKKEDERLLDRPRDQTHGVKSGKRTEKDMTVGRGQEQVFCNIYVYDYMYVLYDHMTGIYVYDCRSKCSASL